MVNNLKIKKYWIVTICMILCSLVSFSQNLSDKEIGFDVMKATISLKLHGVKNEDLTAEISSIRKMYTNQYHTTQKYKIDNVQEKKANQNLKEGSKINTSKTTLQQDISQSQRIALTALYNSTGGANWKTKFGWDSLNDPNIPITYLFGVTIENGIIVKISLSGNNLNGTIPAEIGQLTGLKELSLGGNNLTGIIPAQIGQLQNLENLYLYSNKLTGAIPTQIGQLTSLKNLSLSHNLLTSLPVEIGLLQNLETLSLNNNELTANIPSQIGQLAKLTSLQLSVNQFSGTIPTELLSLPNLAELDLRSNLLSGSIPSKLSQLQSLVRLDLTSNDFTGIIPSELSKLTLLTTLNLGNNQLTGPIPTEFGLLIKLRELSLDQNQLSGTIPSQIGQLLELRQIYLRYNLLNGTIPVQLGLLSNLQGLGLSNNNLNGSIPIELRSLSSLRSFDLAYNKLGGTIPDFTTLADLSSIDISSNQFRFVDFAAQFDSYKKLYSFKYSGQGSTDEEKTINTYYGKSLTLEMYADGRFTGQETYQWYKTQAGGGFFILPSETSRQLKIPVLSARDNGVYFCQSKHPQITIPNPQDQSKNLELFTALIHLNVTDCNPLISGTIKTSVANPSLDENIDFSFETSNTGLSYKWIFYNLDNTTEMGTATTPQVSRSYNTIGDYKITVLVTDANGCSTTFNKIIKVVKVCPTVEGVLKINPENPVLNTVTNFSFETTATGLTYKWTFFNTDNSPKEEQTTSTAKQTYTSYGEYKMRLAVTNTANNCTTTIDKIISIRPDCSYSWDRSGEISVQSESYGDNSGAFINTTTNLTFGKGYGSPVRGLSYKWNLYDANGSLVTTANTLLFPITLTKYESYKVTLTVSDSSGCSFYEKTITARNPNACVVPSTERFQGQLNISIPDWRGVAINIESVLQVSNINGYKESDFTFIWKLYNASDALLNSGDQPTFPITLTSIQEYKVVLEIKDKRGCTTTYTKLITPLDTCKFTERDREGYIATETSSSNNTIGVYENELTNFGFNSYGNPAESFTYEWELFNSKGVSIGQSDLSIYPFTFTAGGMYKINVRVTDPTNGCYSDYTQDIQCFITSSCTNSNSRSQKVKALYDDLLVSLISRSIQGETDAQINASAPSAEFLALKPYITTGPKDKIYNYVSIPREYTSENGRPKIRGARFSFAPNREYDVEALIGWGIGYSPQKSTVKELYTSIRDSLYTDLSQYFTPNEFLISCKSRGGGESRSQRRASSALDYCDYGSQIRFIDFCPGLENTCDPAIVGHIKLPANTIFTSEDYLYTFETTVPNLTYTWTVTTENGEIIGNSEPDIITPFTYNFKYEGFYIIKLIAKNPSGCTAIYKAIITVRDNHCANKPYNFKFESAETNLSYIWNVTNNDNGNIVDTARNATNTYTFTPTLAGNYEIRLTTNNAAECATIFYKYIQITSCGGSVSCTQNNPLTVKVHRLFMDLINKLVSTPNGTDVNVYAKNEIAGLRPYTLGTEAKIYNFINNSEQLSFSFSNNSQSDVILPKSTSGSITSIDLGNYKSSQESTTITTNYSEGSSNTTIGKVRNIDFCPAKECTPIVGTLKFVNTSAPTAVEKKATKSNSKI